MRHDRLIEPSPVESFVVKTIESKQPQEEKTV